MAVAEAYAGCSDGDVVVAGYRTVGTDGEAY